MPSASVPDTVYGEPATDSVLVVETAPLELTFRPEIGLVVVNVTDPTAPDVTKLSVKAALLATSTEFPNGAICEMVAAEAGSEARLIAAIDIVTRTVITATFAVPALPVMCATYY